MKIELKNIHHSEQLSEETNAFTATLYIDGAKAGTASNRGIGGSTDYYPVNEQGKQLIRQAEEYCNNMPPLHYPAKHGMEAFDLDMNLENYIDNLLEQHLKEKDLKQFRKKIERASVNGIAFGVPDQSFRTLKFRVPIETLLVHPNGPNILKDVLAQKVNPNLKEGELIFNTNIPEHVLKDAGLKEGQYLRQDEQQKPQKKMARKNQGRKL